MLELNERKTDESATAKDADFFSADPADPKPVSIDDAVLLKEKKQKDFERNVNKSKGEDDD